MKLNWIALLLASCAGTAEMKPDGSIKVIGPVMARVDRLAVNAKTQLGEFRFLMVNGNSEAVPNNLIDFGKAAVLSKYAFKTVESNNAVETAKIPPPQPVIVTPPAAAVFPPP